LPLVPGPSARSEERQPSRTGLDRRRCRRSGGARGADALEGDVHVADGLAALLPVLLSGLRVDLLWDLAAPIPRRCPPRRREVGSLPERVPPVPGRNRMPRQPL